MLLKATSPATIFRITFGKIVPDYHHCNTSGKADHNHTVHVRRFELSFPRKQFEENNARENIKIGPIIQF